MSELNNELWKLDAWIDEVFDDMRSNWQDPSFLYSDHADEYEAQVDQEIKEAMTDGEVMVAKLISAGVTDRDKVPSRWHYCFKK